MFSRARVFALLCVCLLLGVAPLAAVEARPPDDDSAPRRSFRADARTPASPDDLDGDGVFDSLEKTMQSASVRGQAEIRHPVLVRLREAPTPALIERLQGEAGGFPVHARPGDAAPSGPGWSIVPAFGASLTAGQVRALAAQGSVVHVEPDLEVHAMLGTSKVQSGVSSAISKFGVTGNRHSYEKAFHKDDVVICVVDSGIDAAHVDLDQGQVIGWYDAVSGLSTPYDDNGHGTHVAGIAAGQGDGTRSFRGVAPGAALVGVKVLNSAGSGTTSGILDGIDFCVDNKETLGVDVINLSLGANGCHAGTDALSVAADNAWAAGLVVVVAAGNDGSNPCTVGTPGAAASVLTVGAVSDPNNAACPGHLGGGWYLAPFSSRGRTADGRIKPDLVAPGVCITAPAAGTGNGYATYSGTSMATPFVAGVVALMLDANPSLTPAQVRSFLVSTTQDWGPDSVLSDPQSHDYGAGLLRAYHAIAKARNAPAINISNPVHFHGYGSLARAGQYDEFTLTVTTTAWPIAITLIAPGSHYQNKDFDLYLYDPNGMLVGASETSLRQETISVTPATTGEYLIVIHAFSYQGVPEVPKGYWLDVSAGANRLRLTGNDL